MHSPARKAQERAFHGLAQVHPLIVSWLVMVPELGKAKVWYLILVLIEEFVNVGIKLHDVRTRRGTEQGNVIALFLKPSKDR